MEKILIHFKKLDWILITATLLVVAIGLISIYSSSLGRGDFFNFKKQVIFFTVGFILMILLSFVDWRIFKRDSFLILTLYFLCLFSLIGLYFFAPEIRGIKSWYKLGSFYVGPIEFTKIILIILLAKYFSMRHIEMYRYRHIILSGIYVLLPAVLFFFQPDLGSVLILIAIWIGILMISGIKIRHFLFLALCGLLIFLAAWSFFSKDYQKERIISFINPQVDPKGISWSVNQSKIAIGSGGVLGQGFGHGPQTRYGFLPEPQTDFIFAAIAEESGLVGIGILLSLFALIIWRTIKIAISARSNFPRLFATGFAILLSFQVFINIGMNLGILPIIGIPLPLVSYGGSSLVATFIALGILQSIKTKS